MPLEWLALVSAFSSALAHLVFKAGVGSGVPSIFLGVRWATGALVMTALLLLDAGWGSFRPTWSLALLALGSVLGPVLGWTLYLRALPRLDVSVAQPIFSSSMLVTMLLAVVFIAERPNLFTLLGAALILGGIQLLQHVTTSREAATAASGPRNPWRNLFHLAVLLVLAAAVLLGFSAFFFKVGVDELSPVETNWVRTTVPALVLISTNGLAEARRTHTSMPRRALLTRRGLALAVLAAVANDIVGWLLRLTALKYGLVVIVEPLAATSPLFVGLLSTLLLGERLGRRGWLGVGATVLGAVLLGAWGR